MEHPLTDAFVVRAVVVSLGLLAVLVVCGGIWLSLVERTIPDALIAIGSAAAGSLGTILARTSSEPHPVTIVTEEATGKPRARKRADDGAVSWETVAVAVLVCFLLLILL